MTSAAPDRFVFRSIGVIRTPFFEAAGTPVQGAFAADAEGVVEVDPDLAEGLADLEGFSHLILLYVFDRILLRVFDRSPGYGLRVTPYLDDTERGLFATRAPRRPGARSG